MDADRSLRRDDQSDDKCDMCDARYTLVHDSVSYGSTPGAHVDRAPRVSRCYLLDYLLDDKDSSDSDSSESPRYVRGRGVRTATHARCGHDFLKLQADFTVNECTMLNLMI